MEPLCSWQAACLVRWSPICPLVSCRWMYFLCRCPLGQCSVSSIDHPYRHLQMCSPSLSSIARCGSTSTFFLVPTLRLFLYPVIYWLFNSASDLSDRYCVALLSLRTYALYQRRKAFKWILLICFVVSFDVLLECHRESAPWSLDSECGIVCLSHYPSCHGEATTWGLKGLFLAFFVPVDDWSCLGPLLALQSPVWSCSMDVTYISRTVMLIQISAPVVYESILFILTVNRVYESCTYHFL